MDGGDSRIDGRRGEGWRVGGGGGIGRKGERERGRNRGINGGMMINLYNS